MDDDKQDYTPDIRRLVDKRLAAGETIDEVERALLDDDQWDQDDVITVITEYHNPT